MRNTSIKIDYIAGLLADAVLDYSICGNDNVFSDISLELKKHFKNCDKDEIADIISLCIKMCSVVYNDTTELVITSPDSFKMKSRKTKDVIYSLVKGAKKSITITGYSISDYFNEMLDVIIDKSQQGVYVTLYVNDIEKQKSVLGRVLAYQNRFLKVYEYQKDTEDKMAALHAKILVTDKNLSFVSSANLSYHGMQGNIEMGILLKSKEKAKQIEDLLKELRKMKVFLLYN
ncbi:MAG: phospholipase [Lachnospiraceae bacterium]|nr:phospholipase [Lachnospiraceae bacterium]MBQ6996597.1 phospholipase [Lachnospiraceae bacterium]